VTLLGLVLIFACAPRPRAAPAGNTAAPAPGLSSTRQEIYARASNSFLNVLLFKPAEGSNADLTFRLAPLILQEVGATNQLALLDRDLIGSLAPAEGGSNATLAPPTVYAKTDTVPINGRDHLRLTYLWHYPRLTAVPDALTVQGIRITLDSAAQPAIWEVLTETSSVGLIFVSDSVESAARAQYGPPLSGRHFAIECGADQAPATVVARVIEDGPTAMGPMVYLFAGRHSVSTLTCRCMAAQAKRLLAARVYRIQILPQFSADPAWVEACGREERRFAFAPDAETDPCRIDRCLRLPAGF